VKLPTDPPRRAVAPLARSRSRPRRLDVFLIRPTKYDDDGYLIRHWRNVLPSNSLACLHALTEDVARRGVLGAVDVRTHLCDESVEAVPQRRIRRANRRRGAQALVCLVGVQTSQFPRAVQLALRLRREGVPVLLGGFHVSGTLAMRNGMPAELQGLMDDGVTLVAGEVEETWAAILRDAVAGRLARLYDCLDDKPELGRAPVPHLHPRLERKFVYRHFATIDAGRGCPFTCSFCTIINVQGRAMRTRDADAIAAAVQANHRAVGTHHYFFTDDNFARNPNWRAIFERLIRLRRDRGIAVRFLMQVDALAHRIPDFVQLARRAGCFQVFIGLESLNPESLRDAHKGQNKVAHYAELIAAWHTAGVLTHVGYIIGFPHDTPESVRQDLRLLQRDVQPDIASYFMLTPLPGSADYRRATHAGVAMDADFNRYDTFHPVVDHPHMSRAAWSALYRDAWRSFYAPDYMRGQLRRAAPDQRITLQQIYLWYTAATRVEDYHPMMTGFVRRKPRADRRPGGAPEGRLRHMRHRLPELRAMVTGYCDVLATQRRLWAEVEHGDDAALAGAASARAASVPSVRRALSELRSWRAFLRAMFGSARSPGLRAGWRPAGPPASRMARLFSGRAGGSR
jgi:radical SAM superfamily enzyme YgiQ (UPF0313 family)